jgi:hypothetical protein
MEGGWFDDEAIEQERFDADVLQAQYEAEGNEYARRERRMKRLRAEARWAEAAQACPHGGGFPLDSPAAQHDADPSAGESGWRCWGCGSRLNVSPWDGGHVVAPCETYKEAS